MTKKEYQKKIGELEQLQYGYDMEGSPESLMWIPILDMEIEELRKAAAKEGIAI